MYYYFYYLDSNFINNSIDINKLINNKININDNNELIDYLLINIHNNNFEMNCNLYKEYLEKSIIIFNKKIDVNQLSDLILNIIYISSINCGNFDISKIILEKIKFSFKLLINTINQCDLYDDFSLLDNFKHGFIDNIASNGDIEEQIQNYLCDELKVECGYQLFRLYLRSNYKPSRSIYLSLLTSISKATPLYKYIPEILNNLKNGYYPNDEIIKIFPKMFVLLNYIIV